MKEWLSLVEFGCRFECNNQIDRITPLLNSLLPNALWKLSTSTTNKQHLTFQAGRVDLPSQGNCDKQVKIIFTKVLKTVLTDYDT